ncbi:4'-phosphopantetheinyl transferase family protein [Solwaraspora sp. WMMB335]|uniref:4'-phosphopantetheinyl transferase family protein n=1 Tax=Solwaraspora sp. WMMB335 TaxID=3404118 RepID=UPI003B9499AE
MPGPPDLPPPDGGPPSTGPSAAERPRLLPPPGVDVWHVGLDVDADTVDRVAALLDRHERQRASRFRDVLAARRYVVAHGAARSVLGRYLGLSSEAVDWSTGRHGKPTFDGTWSHWQWSLSRSGGHALLAVRLTEPVGVDIEAVGDHTPAVALAIRFLHESEAAAVAAKSDPSEARLLYHRLLSRKEACVKCSGGRLLDGLRIRVLSPGSVSGTGPTAADRWQLQDLPAPPGFVATLATVGKAIDRLRLFEWQWHQSQQDVQAEGAPEGAERDPSLGWVGVQAVERGGNTVHARFTPSDVPVLTTSPPHRVAAVHAAVRTLNAHGRSHLGGHLEVKWSPPGSGPHTPGGSEYLAAARAVETALRQRPSSTDR